MDERFSKIESDVEEIKQRVYSHGTDIAVLKTDVAHIKGDVSEARAELRGVREHQERDFRILFGAIISVALGLSALMAKAFGWFH